MVYVGQDTDVSDLRSVLLQFLKPALHIGPQHLPKLPNYSLTNDTASDESPRGRAGSITRAPRGPDGKFTDFRTVNFPPGHETVITTSRFHASTTNICGGLPFIAAPQTLFKQSYASPRAVESSGMDGFCDGLSQEDIEVSMVCSRTNWA